MVVGYEFFKITLRKLYHDLMIYVNATQTVFSH